MNVTAVVKSKVCEYDIVGTSDHCAIEMVISVNQYIPKSTTGKMVWLKSRANWDPINEACQALHISDAIFDPDPKKFSDMLMAILISQVSGKVTNFRTNGQPGTCHIVERNYNNSLKRKIEGITQPQLWWTQLASSVYGSYSSSIPPLLTDDCRLVTGPREKAELLQQAFETKQSAEDVPFPDTFHPESLLTKFAFRSRDDKRILDNLYSWSGENPDGFVPFFFFRVLAPKFSRFYRFLCRRSIFVDECKFKNTEPVPKSGISAGCSNYRPISITTLPVLFKIAEKLIFKSLYKYIESKGLLADSQYPYRKRLGTCYALLVLTRHLQGKIDKGFECRVIQIDFSAAFDLVNHKALSVHKLHNLGVGR
ncbi:uncharacterized protein LOC135207395 [Macrobrachium nipponense]|uniref:uncharacterized protein LOC135207395 n=1 Tax=Macrobrachium nipponense TaxID=159736 RepID=UPI0030C874AA